MNIAFTSGLYATSKTARRISTKSANELNKYANNTDSDIFITSVDKQNQKNNSYTYYTVTVNNGGFYYQKFKDSNMASPVTKDATHTIIPSSAVHKKEKTPEIVQINKLTFDNGKAYKKETNELYDGLAYKKNKKNNNFLVLKFNKGNILTSKLVDKDNNLISKHFYGYYDSKHTNTIKFTPKGITFIEYKKQNGKNSIIYRDGNYIPKKIIEHQTSTDKTNITYF